MGDIGVDVILGSALLKLGEASSPLMVRHGNSAPRWLISAARSRARPSMLCRNRSRFRAILGWV